MDTELASGNLEGRPATEVRAGLVGDPSALGGYAWLGGEPVDFCQGYHLVVGHNLVSSGAEAVNMSSLALR